MEGKSQDLSELYTRYKPYLLEARKHLFVVAIIFIIGALIGLFNSQQIFKFVLSLFSFQGVGIITTSPYQYISLSLTISFIVGILFSLPYALFRSFLFFKPALKPSEVRLLIFFAPLSILLFVIGFLFGLWITQQVINFYSSVWGESGVNNYWDIQKFFSQIIFTSFLTGLIFQVPIVVTLLIRLNIVKRSIMVKKRKYVYLLLLVVAVFLPPTDLFSLIMLTLPLFFLFEFGLLLNRK